MEEAGCVMTALELIGSFFVSPGYSDDRVTLYCGCVRADSVAGTHGVCAEGEDTRVVVVDFKRASAELFSGRIDTTAAIIGIQWLTLNRARLRAEWDRSWNGDQWG